VPTPRRTEPLKLLVYSDNARTREKVRSALGKRVHPDLPELSYLDVATAPVVVSTIDQGGIDLAILDGEALALEIALDHLAVLDDDDGFAFEHWPRSWKPVADPGHEYLEDGDRSDDEDCAGQRIVVLRQALLERVAKHDQQDQVEGLEGAELTLADDPGQQEHEGKDEDGAENEVHG